MNGLRGTQVATAFGLVNARRVRQYILVVPWCLFLGLSVDINFMAVEMIFMLNCAV